MRDSTDNRLQHIDNLIFVSSISVYREPEAHTEALEALRDIVGDRLVILDPDPVDVYEAAGRLRMEIDKLRFAREITQPDGVIVIGDYLYLPSRPVQVVTDKELYQEEEWAIDGYPGEIPIWPLNKKFDSDLWRVWNDDLYGDLNGDMLGDVPVSRIPVFPATGLLGQDAQPPPYDELSVVSEDFPFTSEVIDRYFHEGRVFTSPPDAAGSPDSDGPAPGGYDIESDDLSAKRLYLALHSNYRSGSVLSGRRSDGEPPDTTAIGMSLSGEGASIAGTVFLGACWGALVAEPAREVKPGESVSPRTIGDSIALALVNRGANAVIGFTGLHYVPRGSAPWAAYGAMLHHYFWYNVIGCHMSPARALFVARAQYVLHVSSLKPDRLAVAIAMKTYWSATCLGIGWKEGSDGG